MNEKKLHITKIKSSVGCTKYQLKVLKGLGLRKINHTVIRENTPEIRGMINKIPHLLKWETK